MNRSKNQFDIGRKDFTIWQTFRLIFTIFSLYLMGDIFYRWDAFKMHSSLPDYIPNIALASILWSIVALAVSVCLWVMFKIIMLACRLLTLKVQAEHLAIYIFIFPAALLLAWAIKKTMWPDLQTSPYLKLSVVAFVISASILPAWFLRRKASFLISEVQQRITPLIWVFAVWILISLTVTSVHMAKRETRNMLSPNLIKLSSSQSNNNRPNIILISFDALTARHMSVYGYDRPTTPFIEKWSKSASLFSRAQAGSSYTAATTPGLMTGKRTWTHRKYHHDIAAKPTRSETENLALVLKKNGYHNSAFIANVVTPVNALGISRSFDTAPGVIEFSSPRSIEGMMEKYLFLLFGDTFNTYNWLGQDDFLFTVLLRKIDKKVYVTEFPPDLAFDKFLHVRDSNSREPFFAWIHVMPPHAPYAPPEPFAGTFNASKALREKNEMYRYNPDINKYSSQGLPFPDFLKEKIATLNDYYDEFILYCDKQFENFIAELEKRAWINNTVIILTSDHGESFRHDYFQHGPPHLYEEVTHIPLVIKEPGQSSGRVIETVVEQVDVPATILDLVNIPVPSWMEGRSLVPLMKGKELPARHAVAVSLYGNSPADPITKGTVALWDGDYKLIHYLDTGKSLLFNLRSDPDELKNLYNQDRIRGERLLALIYDKLSEANNKVLSGQ